MQRKLHPLEGIVAVFALFFVLALTIGFAQAGEPKIHKTVYLRSSSALVLDADTGEVVIDKNADAVTPIASITKLMTAMVILDRNLDLDQKIVISRDVRDSLKRTRLRPGNVLTRGELLLLALMASENRAAAALGRTYPGGLEPLVAAMNAKAAALDQRPRQRARLGKGPAALVPQHQRPGARAPLGCGAFENRLH